MSSELFTVCLWAGYGGSRSETQGGGFSREQFPTKHDSSSGTRDWSITSELLLFNVYFLLLMFVKWV